jgi:pyrroline-5-carboxylate reductase
MAATIHTRRVAVIGAGRLGRAIAPRLGAHSAIDLADVEPDRAQQFATQHGLRFRLMAQIADEADVIALCVPPDQVVAALQQLAARGVGGLCVNFATSVSTATLASDPRLAGLEVVGLKLVGQFSAVARGVPALLVTSSVRYLAQLREVFGGLGPVMHGDEDLVVEVNRTATQYALRACADLYAELATRNVDRMAVDAAVRNVFAGTALDYPPDPANPYTATLLAAERHAR